MKFMCIKGASAAILCAALFVAVTVSATAQQPAQVQNALIRFSDGALFEVPQGWSWSEFNPSGRVLIAYDRTEANNRRNPNILQITLYDSPPSLVKSWTRVDVDRSQMLPNGVSVRWKVGMAGHMYFEAIATIASKTFYLTAQDNFNRATIEAAFLKIASTMREVPKTSLVFHPEIPVALIPLDRKRWGLATYPNNFSLICQVEVCGPGSTTNIVVGHSSVRGKHNDLNSLLAGMRASQKDLVIGEERRERIAGGEIVWTEQPGSRFPFLGAVDRNGEYFVVYMTAFQKMTESNDGLRNDYLTAARSVRPRDGQ